MNPDELIQSLMNGTYYEEYYKHFMFEQIHKEIPQFCQHMENELTGKEIREYGDVLINLFIINRFHVHANNYIKNYDTHENTLFDKAYVAWSYNPEQVSTEMEYELYCDTFHFDSNQSNCDTITEWLEPLKPYVPST